MALTCNIDAVGKRARLQMGIVSVALAIVLFIIAVVTAISWLYIPATASLLGGAFAIFEARAGWCAIRAMGFKTRI